MVPPVRGLAPVRVLDPGRGAALAALVVLAGLAGCGDGCIDRGAGPNLGADPALVARNLLSEVPAELAQRLDAAFALPAGAAKRRGTDAGAEGPGEPGVSVVYVGAIIEADPGERPGDESEPPSKPRLLTALIPGEPFRIRHFWRVVRPPGEGLRVFTYLRGGDDRPDFMNLDDSPMRRAHPPAKWQAGEIIQDVQRVVLRPDWTAPTATLLVGLMRRGGHSPADRLAVKRGPAEANAVMVRALPVDLAKAPPPPGTVRVTRASAPVTVDGRGDEAAWSAVPWSPDFPAAEGSPEPVGRARAKLAWDDEHLYALIHVEDRDVASPYANRDDPLWRADCVELFIDADRNRRQYVELQVNPRNAQFDSYFATTKAQPGDVTFSAGMQSAVVVHGTLDQRGDVDGGWDAELAVPWAAVRGGDPAMEVRLPPQPGDGMRLNLVRVDKPADKALTASSWNRITYSDFHALERMLEVVFTAPPAVPAPSPAPSSPGAAASSSAPSSPGAAASSSAPSSPGVAPR